MRRLASYGSLLALFAVGCSSDSSSPQTTPPGTDSGTDSGGSEKPDAAPPAKDSGGTPETDSGAGEASTDAATSPVPLKLSQTGLFTNIATRALGQGVQAYEPKYKLWSDGAEKHRWVRLPAGQKIDTSDMDYWKYPEGTTAWKEFDVGSKHIETRMLRKLGPNPTDWVMIAYQWNDAQTDADAVPDGVQNASGTEHDIPSAADCQQCHGNMKDRLLGVTAIQLSHDLGGLTITDLINDGTLTDPPAAPFQIPGPAVAETALGYLHANCGHCHNPMSGVYASVSLRLWESTQRLTTLENTTGYATTVLQQNSYLPQFHVIEPGKPDESELFYRISRRGSGQMPPLATEVVDDTGVAAVRAFIESLPPVSVDGGAPEGGTGPVDAGTGPADAGHSG